jgi:hypothetical protein
MKVDLDLGRLFDAHDYRDEETVTLKVPLVLPYHIDLSEFERVDGKIEYNGQHYRLIKQKLINDTLHIVCYRDKHTQQIEQVLSDYVKTFTDNPVHDKHQAKELTGFLKDFLPTGMTYQSSNGGWNRTLSFSHLEPSTCTTDLPVDSPPPKA